MFEINTTTPTTDPITKDKTEALKKALVTAGLRVCGLGKDKCGIFATRTSKTPCWKVEFNSAGLIVNVFKRDWTRRAWDDGGLPLSYYKECAKFIFEKKDQALVDAYREEQKRNAAAIAPAM